MSYLLFRKPILDGESMCSWLHRLKIANGFVDRRGLLGTKLSNVSRLGDPDLTLTSEQIALLQELTGLPEREQREHMIDKLERYLVSSFDRAGRSRWLLRTGNAANHTNCCRYVVCPHCLHGDPDPYYRWYWRIALYCICHRHRTPMIDACPNCGALFTIAGDRKTPLGYCVRCHARLTARADLPKKLAFHAEIERHLHWEHNFLNEESPAIEVPVAYDFIRYDGLYALVSALCRRRIAVKLRRNANSELALALRALPSYPSGAFEALPAIARFHILAIALWLLDDWPRRYVETFRSNGLLFSDISTVDLALPYWLDRVTREELYYPRYMVSKEEIAGATAVLRRTRKNFKKVHVERILGIYDSGALETHFRFKPLSEVLACKLVAHLDCEMADAPRSRAHQASTIRDGIGIIFIIGLRIDVTKVCALDNVEAAKAWHTFIRRDARNSRSVHGALMKQVINAGKRWLPIYSKIVRPQFLACGSGCDHFLITRFGKAYHGHGLYDRFVTLLRLVGYAHPERGFRALSDVF